MKIKNKFRYIFIFGLVFLLLVSFSISAFAVLSGYTDSNLSIPHSSDEEAYFYCDSFEYFTSANTKVKIDDVIYCYISYYSSLKRNVLTYKTIQDTFTIILTYSTDIICYTSLTDNQIALFDYDIYGIRRYYTISDKQYVRYNSSYYYYYNIVQPDQPLTKTYDVGSFYNNNTLYNQIIVDGVSEDSSSFTDLTSITYINSTENYQSVVYDGTSWTSGYNSNLGYFWNATVPTVSSINSDLNSLITFSTSVIATELDKLYNLDFQQNGSIYTNIQVVGTTINGSTFNSIHSINYNSDQVYVNNNFVSGYSNYLGYTYTPPDSTVLSNLNSDLGGLLVFYTVHVNPTPEEKFFHDIDVSTNGILTIVYAFANNLLSNILLITMCIALPLVSFAVVQVIRIYKIKKG